MTQDFFLPKAYPAEGELFIYGAILGVEKQRITSARNANKW